MASFNKVILAGNLTRDPELRYTPKGTAVCELSIAVSRKFKTESGEQREEVCFAGCVAFGRQAETIAQYLQKGRPLLVEGRLAQDKWEDKQTGQARSKTKVIIESFQFIDSKSDGQQGQPRQQSQPPKQASQPSYSKDISDDEDQQIPF